VAFLDADDEWFPLHLERSREAIRAFPQVSVYGCGYQIVEGKGKDQTIREDLYYQQHFSESRHELSFHDYLLAENHGARPICTSVAVISQAVLLRTGAYPEGRAARGGDVDTWLRCVEYADGLAWSPYIGATYYRSSVNMVTRTSWDDAQIQRETVQNMIMGKKPKVQRELRIFANRRTVSAWLLNRNSAFHVNFLLPTRLDWRVDLVRNVFWSWISLLPVAVGEHVINFSRTLRRASKSSSTRTKVTSCDD
jgi:hypothetical protein